jgi:hypothetical protein
MLFSGFKRCLYPAQRFQSDPERRFAVLLENDVAGTAEPFAPLAAAWSSRSANSLVRSAFLPRFLAFLGKPVVSATSFRLEQGSLAVLRLQESTGGELQDLGRAIHTGLHLARSACRPAHQCPASPVSGVHVPCLTDSPALARFRRAPMPRRSSCSSKARRR